MERRYLNIFPTAGLLFVRAPLYEAEIWTGCGIGILDPNRCDQLVIGIKVQRAGAHTGCLAMDLVDAGKSSKRTSRCS